MRGKPNKMSEHTPENIAAEAGKEKMETREVHHHHYHGGHSSLLGTFILVLGGLYLLRALGFIPYFHFGNILMLWPVLIIAVGVSLIRGGFWRTVLQLVILFAVLFLILNLWGIHPGMMSWR